MQLRDEGSRLARTLAEALNHSIANPRAACAIEGKDIAEQRPDVVGKSRLEHAAGAVQTGLNGFRT